jgi:hypothetical protein
MKKRFAMTGVKERASQSIKSAGETQLEVRSVQHHLVPWGNAMQRGEKASVLDLLATTSNNCKDCLDCLAVWVIELKC